LTLSNTKGRLALFMDVIGVFLKSLDEENYQRVPAHIRQWYEKESNGWFGTGDTAERKAKVGQLGRYMYRLLECFREDEAVVKSEAYKLLKRLDAGVMGRDRFEFDEDGHVVSCPEGHPAIDHKILSNNSTERTLYAIFDGDMCRQCPKLEKCPVRAPNHRKKGESPRETTGDFRLEITPGLRLRDDMLQKQQTPEWKDEYKIRSGIEATMSELKRGYGMAKLRVRGLARVCFAVACKVIACNIKRWWRATRAAGSGDTPLSTEPSSPFEIVWPRRCSILRGVAIRKMPIPDITLNTIYVAA
jgi:hypothetical protein